MKNRIPWNKGIKRTAEEKIKISQATKGKNKGRIVSLEHREKISKALIGIKHSAQRKINNSAGHMGQKAWNKGLRNEVQ